jgi:pimeloyl-ACP methyl ester carboxylesterase
MVTMPALDGVTHHFVELGEGVTIHVADAGPADGPVVMFVHGFPENWWEWHELIGPLAADGYRVVCPDLRGAGWSSAPRSRYTKAEKAEDLAAVLDHLGIDSVKLVAHDWGGPTAFIMMLRHPEKVTGFFGINTVAPFVNRNVSSLLNLWRLWYQIPISLPVIGPRLLRDPNSRFLRMLGPWVGGGFSIPDDSAQLYLECMREPGHAEAGSRWYRSYQTGEMWRWVRGQYADARVEVPVRWLTGTRDPVITADLTQGYRDHISDFEVELVDGAGHWIVAQQPDLVLDRVRAFVKL